MAGRKSWIDTTLPSIEKELQEVPQRVFILKDISRLLITNRRRWKLPEGLTRDAFVKALIKADILKPTVVSSPNYNDQKNLYLLGDPSPLAVGLALRPDSYLSHASAMYIHSLTHQLSKNVYVNKEQSAKPPNESGLNQEAIHRAFKAQQRQSQFIYHYNDFSITIINGKSSNKLQTYDVMLAGELFATTKLERTLIDIAVRPEYSGGIFQVIEAYRTARDQVSVPLLLATLRQLDYSYPYHQVIGFYLEKTGYPARMVDRFRAIGLEVDFYLAYGMIDKEYEASWRLYVPSGLNLDG